MSSLHWFAIFFSRSSHVNLELNVVVIASEAKQSSLRHGGLDCFVASLLAMTNSERYWSRHGLAYILHRHRLPLDFGILLGERDRADRRLARLDVAVVEAGQPRSRCRHQPV